MEGSGQDINDSCLFPGPSQVTAIAQSALAYAVISSQGCLAGRQALPLSCSEQQYFDTVSYHKQQVTSSTLINFTACSPVAPY